MSRMLNRLRDADSSRDDNKKKHNPHDAVLTKNELAKEKARREAEKQAADTQSATQQKDSPTQAETPVDPAPETSAPARENDQIGDTHAHKAEPEEAHVQAPAEAEDRTSAEQTPDMPTPEAEPDPEPEPQSLPQRPEYARLDEGVGHAEVSALFDEEEDVHASVESLHAEKRLKTRARAVKGVFLGLLFVISGSLLVFGIMQSGLMRRAADDTISLDAPVTGVSETIEAPATEAVIPPVPPVPQVELIRFVIADFDSPGSETAARVFRARSSLVQGLKPELDDYALNITFIQNGTQPYPAIIEFPFNDVSVQGYSEMSLAVRGSGLEDYPLRAVLILYHDMEKYEKNLGWLDHDWKKYTIPLSSFEGLPADADLVKMRIEISQPRQLNSKYEMFIDDIELVGTKGPHDE